MDVKILAICDTDKQYARRLMEAFCVMEPFVFRVHAFSTEEELHIFARQERIEVLLIAGQLISAPVLEMNAGKIVLLSEGGDRERFPEYEAIYKYQSAEQIMKELLSYYAEYAGTAAESGCYQKEFEVYGVYTPSGAGIQTVFAETLGIAWGKKKKTLLLSFQSYMASPQQYESESVWDLSDMIYFLRQGKKTFSYKLGSVVRERSGFDEIFPMKFPEDLRSVTLGEWTELLEKLAAESGYQRVVIDFGNDVNGLYELLSQCTEVYMPVLPDRISQAKTENFEWILREKNFERLKETINKVRLPEKCDERTIQIVVSGILKRCEKTDDRGNDRN